MAWISAVFFCLGAADTLLGDRLGLGSAFRQGFAAVVDLLLLMTGFMALAPWLGTHLAPVITPVFSAVGCDPSLFASLFLSCDAGGAVLAAQIAQEPSAGLYNGLIVAAFLGSTINGTIPLALGQLTGTKRAAAVRGLFLGFLVLPVGCLLTGALCGIPLSVLLHNTWPVLAVAVLLLLLFKSGSSAIGPIFNGISLAVRGLTLFGFCISVLQETTGIVLLEGLTPLAEIYPVICSIGAFLAGILPFFAFVQRLLTAPLAKLAARLQLEPASITGLVAKENIVGTLGILYGGGDETVYQALGTVFTQISGYSFLVFNLLCAPCFAAIGAIKREMNSRKWTWFAIGYQCVFAYVIALMINQFGGLFTGSVNVIGLIFALAALALMVYMLVRPYKEATKLNATV